MCGFVLETHPRALKILIWNIRWSLTVTNSWQYFCEFRGSQGSSKSYEATYLKKRWTLKAIGAGIIARAGPNKWTGLEIPMNYFEWKSPGRLTITLVESQDQLSLAGGAGLDNSLMLLIDLNLERSAGTQCSKHKQSLLNEPCRFKGKMELLHS